MHLIIKSAGLMRSALLTVAATNAICHTDCYLLDNCDFLLTLPQAQERVREREGRERARSYVSYAPLIDRLSFHHLQIPRGCALLGRQVSYLPRRVAPWSRVDSQHIYRLI